MRASTPIRLSLLVSALVLVGTVFVFPASAAAQAEETKLGTWDVQIWPEYDEPSVLVITTGSVVSGTVFPRRMALPLPAGAKVHAVAYPEASGNLLTLPWTTESTASGQGVSFELTQPRFVVEYYADILSPTPDRRFALDLVVPYAAQQASLALRQPSRASNLQTTPAMVADGVDELGNPTYALDLGALAAGQGVSLQVSYEKADADPSVSKLTAEDVSTSDIGTDPGWMPVAFGIIGGLVVGAGIIYFVLRRRTSAPSRQARRRDARKKGVRPAPQPQASPSDRFCVQCGHEFEGGDKFCRNCGAARR